MARRGAHGSTAAVADKLAVLLDVAVQVASVVRSAKPDAIPADAGGYAHAGITRVVARRAGRVDRDLRCLRSRGCVRIVRVDARWDGSGVRTGRVSAAGASDPHPVRVVGRQIYSGCAGERLEASTAARGAPVRETRTRRCHQPSWNRKDKQAEQERQRFTRRY